MNVMLLSYLRCPYCRGALRKDTLDGDFGIISCACDKYPIVAGIIYLQKNDALLNKHAVRAVSRKQYGRAFWQVLSGPRVQKMVMYCVWALRCKWGISISRKNVLKLMKVLSTNKSWFDYLLHRDESIDISMATNSLSRASVRGEIIADIGCGTGSLYEHLHAVRQMRSGYIGIEKNVNSLLFARLYLEGDALWVCSDIEQGIPIVDSVIADTLFVDCFAWIYHKERTLAESKRILMRKGTVTIVNIYAQTLRTKLWGYGVSPDYLRKIMKKYFSKITFFNNDRPDRIIGLAMRCLHKERYSCQAVKE